MEPRNTSLTPSTVIYFPLLCVLLLDIFYEFLYLIFKLEYYFFYNFSFSSPTIFIFHFKLYYVPNLQNYEL